MSTRNLVVDALARVEGEGALTLRLEGDEVVECKLRIFEPPRFFEALLAGRPTSPRASAASVRSRTR